MEDHGSIGSAEDLVLRVLRLARQDDYKALLAIDADPASEVLLGLLSERQTAPAKAHLRAARSWKKKQNQRAAGKFEAASKALDEFDVVLAKGIMRRIDAQVLEPAQLERYDELLLAITARVIEFEEIEGRPPDDPKPEKRRFGRN